MQLTTNTAQFTFPAHREWEFIKKAEQAPKHFKPFTLTRVREFSCPDTGKRMVDYTWTGPMFAQREGWTLVAKCDWVPGKGASTVFLAPTKGIEVPTEPRCDHCKAARHRNSTYIARHEDGRVLALGGDCAKTYWGTSLKLPLFWQGMDEVLAEVDDGDGYGGGFRARYAYDVRTVLSLAIPHIAKYGYVKADIDGKMPTRDIVQQLQAAFDFLGGPGTVPDTAHKGIRGIEVVVATDAEVDAVIAWANAQPVNDSSYWQTVHGALAQGWFTHKLLGFIAALPFGFSKRPTEASVAAAKTRGHVGVVGQRHKVGTTVTVKRVMSFDTEYGTRVVTLMEDAAGNIIKSTGKMPVELAREGDVATITFFVKAHSEFRGVLQTEVNRVSLA